jgi:hypothetical protein
MAASAKETATPRAAETLGRENGKRKQESKRYFL